MFANAFSRGLYSLVSPARARDHAEWLIVVVIRLADMSFHHHPRGRFQITCPVSGGRTQAGRAPVASCLN